MASRTHAIGIIALVLIIGVFLASNVISQNTSGTSPGTGLYTAIPDEMRVQAVPVVSKGVDVKPLLDKLESGSGFAFAAYAGDGRIYVVRQYDEPHGILLGLYTTNKALIYRVEPSGEFWEMDCGTFSNAIDTNPSNAITIDQYVSNGCPSLETDAFGRENFKGYLLPGLLSFKNSVTALGTDKYVITTPKGSANKLVIDDKDLIPVKVSIDQTAQPLPMTNGKVSFDAAAEINSEVPNYFKITDPTNPKSPTFFVEVFRLGKVDVSGTDYLKIGMRIFVLRDGTYQDAWNKETLNGAFTISSTGAIDNATDVSNAQLYLLQIGKPVTMVAKNGSFGEIKGSVTNTNNNSVTVSLDFSNAVTKIGILDQKTILRLRFDEATELKILTLDEFKGKGADAIYSSDQLVIALEDVLAGKTFTMQSVAGTAGLKAHLSTDPTIPFLPAKYIMKIKIEGYKEIDTAFAAGYAQISSSNTSTVTNGDLVLVPIIETLTKDPCQACKDLQTCLVCVDDRLIASYVK